MQTCPRVLYDYRTRADSMMSQKAMHEHLAMVGLLIERHLPDGDERELLVSLTHGWGVGALLAALAAEGLRDTFRDAHPDETEVGTFGGWVGRTGGAKIDHVLADDGFDTVAASIDRRQFDGRDPSDHFPVHAVVRSRAHVAVVLNAVPIGIPGRGHTRITPVWDPIRIGVGGV